MHSCFSPPSQVLGNVGPDWAEFGSLLGGVEIGSPAWTPVADSAKAEKETAPEEKTVVTTDDEKAAAKPNKADAKTAAAVDDTAAAPDAFGCFGRIELDDLSPSLAWIKHIKGKARTVCREAYGCSSAYDGYGLRAPPPGEHPGGGDDRY